MAEEKTKTPAVVLELFRADIKSDRNIAKIKALDALRQVTGMPLASLKQAERLNGISACAKVFPDMKEFTSVIQHSGIATKSFLNDNALI